MIHNVAPPRSDESAFLPGAQPRPAAVADALPPGPISWDVETAPTGAGLGRTAPESSAPGSWDSVPHPVGQLQEPPPLARAGTPLAVVSPDPEGPAAAGDDEPSREARRGRGRAPRPRVVTDVEERPLLATVVHSLGPVGRHRSPAVVFVAAVLTLGLQPVAWIRRTNAEMAHFDPRMVARPGRTAAALATAALLPLLAAAAEAARLAAGRIWSTADLPLSGSASRWLLLGPAVAPLLAVVVPFSLVALTMTLERVRVVEDRAGVDPEHQLSPAGSVWWAAVPVVGLAIVLARAQHRLNRVWEACARPHRR